MGSAGSVVSSAWKDTGSTISKAAGDTVEEVGRVEFDPIADLQDPIGAADKGLTTADDVLNNPESVFESLFGGYTTISTAGPTDMESSLGGQVGEEEETNKDLKSKPKRRKTKGSKSLQNNKTKAPASAATVGVQI